MGEVPAVVVLGRSGLEVARRIARAHPAAELHGPAAKLARERDLVLYPEFAPALRDLYLARRPIVALCASGIVIRVLAPLIEDKASEPPVVVVAEDGSVVVPLLGGHRGANRLARSIAEALGCLAAITTAGDLRFDLALDSPPAGWRVRNPGAAKAITSALLGGEDVALCAETGDAGWLLAGGARFVAQSDFEVCLTDRDDPGSASRLVLHPAVLALGVGCERGVAPAELIGLAEATLERHDLAREAIGCVVSIELKAAEPAVHGLAAHFGVPARFFSAAELDVQAPRLATPSAEVFAATGCHGVAEGAALAAAGPAGTLVVTKTKSARATCALARAPAPLSADRIGRPQGRLAIIGLGPGSADWRTPEATALLDEAEHWVGYGGYLDLLAARSGHPVVRHPFALGEEEARARRALDLAAQGHRVALISSGDPGIYAMAALVFELLERCDEAAWRRIAVVVSPGVSALQAAAARAGAPLGHDFCAISLSDLLTPWEDIERRLEAAAAGDFVTVLYNPASIRRRRGLVRALEILQSARSPTTPVVHARNLGRSGETVTIVPLAEFDPGSADMLSVLIVGSSRTRLHAGGDGRAWVYTPRGYALEPP